MPTMLFCSLPFTALLVWCSVEGAFIPYWIVEVDRSNLLESHVEHLIADIIDQLPLKNLGAVSTVKL